MSSPPTIAVIAAGEMGATIAARLTAHGCTVLTDLTARSPGTIARAERAGMHHAPLSEICTSRGVRWIHSIVPPSDAHAFALRCLDAGLGRDGRESPVFVDCNAVNPASSREIGRLLRERAPRVEYLDGGIIGGPPRSDADDPKKATYEPNLYASAEKDVEERGTLKAFGELRAFGLPVRIMEGAGLGGASALKMSYSGIMKGLSGLLTTMVLASHADSPTTTAALLAELAHSSPQMLARSEKSLVDTQGKAYRFVGEMREMAQFVEDGLGPRAAAAATEATLSQQPLVGPGLIFEGLAQMFQRLADSVAKGEGDVDVLNEWVAKAKETREGSSS